MSTISINNLAEAIYESSTSALDSATVSKNAIDYMARHNLMGKAPDILAKLEEIVDKNSGTVRAKIYSKTKLTTAMKDEVKDLISKRYKAREIILTENIDERLLGGIKIEIGDEVIDMTLRSKLNKLESYLKNSQ